MLLWYINYTTLGNLLILLEPLVPYLWMAVIMLLISQVIVKFKWERVCTAPSLPSSIQLVLNLQHDYSTAVVGVFSSSLDAHDPSPASGHGNLTPTSSGGSGSTSPGSWLTRPIPAPSSCSGQGRQRRPQCLHCAPSAAQSSSALDPAQEQIAPPGASLEPAQWSSCPPEMGNLTCVCRVKGLPPLG